MNDQSDRRTSGRLIRLRRSEACTECGQLLERGGRAWWEPSAKTVTCTTCRPAAPTRDSPPSDAPLDVGVAGGSARQRYEQLHQRREDQLERRWGRLAGIAKFLSDDPQSITVWAKGSKGEQKLADHLVQAVGDRAVLLHDRMVPGDRRNIDHIVVAPSGVWVIDTKLWSGLVELRDVGGWFKVDRRLYVKGRDRTSAVDGMAWQVEAVRLALEDTGNNATIHAALCFIEADWRWFAKPFELKGVRVSGPKSLALKIAEGGQLAPDKVMQTVRSLAEALPSKGS